MPYTPDPADPSQPVGNVLASTAAAEFRAIKAFFLAGLTFGNNVVPNIASLKASVNLGAVTNVVYIVIGFAAAGDGGGGFYWWNKDDVNADNGGTIIEVDSGGTGRFNKLF